MPHLEDAFILESGSGPEGDSDGAACTAIRPGVPPELSYALRFAGALLVVVQLGFCWVALPTTFAGRVDFRAFYAAGYLLVHGRGHDLYSYAVMQQTQDALFAAGFKTLPFLYPAYAAALFAPFALAPYRVAFLLFCGLNLVCLGIAARLLCARVPALAGLPRIAQFGVLLAFFPVAMALMQGQISFLLLLVYVFFERLLNRRMHWLAGLVLALGLVKFQIAVPVALLLLAWRSYRVIAGFVCGAAALALASLALCGREGVIAYWQSTSRMAGSTLVDPAGAKLRYGMFAADMPNLHGLFFTLSRGRLLGSELAVVASIAVMLWAWRQRPSIVVALPAAMLMSYHMQAYDLVLLLLPLMLALGAVQGWQSERAVQVARRLLIASVVLLTAPVAAVLLVKGLSSVMALGVVGVLIAGGSVRLDGGAGEAVV